MTAMRVAREDEHGSVEEIDLHDGSLLTAAATGQPIPVGAPVEGAGAGEPAARLKIRSVGVALIVVAQLWGLMAAFDASIAGQAGRVLAFEGACFAAALVTAAAGRRRGRRPGSRRH